MWWTQSCLVSWLICMYLDIFFKTYALTKYPWFDKHTKRIPRTTRFKSKRCGLLIMWFNVGFETATLVGVLTPTSYFICTLHSKLSYFFINLQKYLLFPLVRLCFHYCYWCILWVLFIVYCFIIMNGIRNKGIQKKHYYKYSLLRVVMFWNFIQ